MRALQSMVGAALLLWVGLSPAASAQAARWTEQKANAWYAQQPWLVGSNYVPKSAINQLEMWQEATPRAFDLRTLVPGIMESWDQPSLDALGPIRRPARVL